MPQPACLSAVTRLGNLGRGGERGNEERADIQTHVLGSGGLPAL